MKKPRRPTSGRKKAKDPHPDEAEATPSAPVRGTRLPGGLFERILGKRSAVDCLSQADINKFYGVALSLNKPNDEVAEESAAALRLAQKIRSRDIFIPNASARLGFILDCLKKKPPSLILARDARLQMQIEVYSKSGLVSRALAKISDGSSVGLVLTALVASTIIWAIMALLIHAAVNKFDKGLTSDIFFMNGRALVAISSAAFVGGVVSIATRLKEFSRVRDLDPFAMFWTAMLKPLIGVVLSFFILAALEGGVVTFSFLKTDKLSDPQSNALYVLWMMGFLAGFSERFAWDFVSRTEGIVGQKADKTKKTG
jgi:hypothetical protein